MKIKTHLKWWNTILQLRWGVFYKTHTFICYFILKIFDINPVYKCEISWSYLCRRTQPASWSEGIPCSTGVCVSVCGRPRGGMEAPAGGERQYLSEELRLHLLSVSVSAGCGRRFLFSPMSHGESGGWCVQLLFLNHTRFLDFNLRVKCEKPTFWIKSTWFLRDINKS